MNKELPICPIHKIHIIGKTCEQCSSDKEYELEELESKWIEDSKD